MSGFRQAQIYLGVLLSLCSLALPAAESCTSLAGHLATLEGQVTVQSSGVAGWQPATLNQSLCKGDTVRAGARSRATVVLVNQAVLRIDQNTAMRLDNISPAPQEKSFFSLLKGTLQSFSRKPHTFAVSTPYLNGSIEGTEFMFRADARESELIVFEGKVKASNKNGTAAVPGGSAVVSVGGAAPQPRTLVHPRDAAQWSLYYPSVLATGGKGGQASAPLQQAASDMSVGRVDEARAGVDRIIAAGGADAGPAYALRAIINVVQNRREQAQSDADHAVQLGPDSVAANIALSYVQQADFHIEAARKTLQQAVSQHPDSALALARLSELQLMSGDNGKAVATARKAAALAPDLGRAQITLGFAALAQFHNDEATAAFQRAIALDSADPMPHLGLGLARISAGKLEAGRADLEVAVALDGNNALLRDYLGKAYFEEKRTPLDAQQYSIARQLDPKDPTPYLYDGILKQTENDPVGALDNVEKSVELNGNRAVYRSRLLLDSDEAARNVSLARIHDDLGFQQLALVEGYDAVNTDPTNSSAHRYLADSYSVLPRHEIARVSELLQSQLLNPLNLEPVQPRAAESNLYLISAGGPATASYNEFNSLFKRDQVNAILSGTVGGLGTASGDAVVSGVHNNWSWSVGASRFRTDGFRPNNDQDDNIGDAFVQTALSPDTSVQFEYRHRDLKNGDLNLHMDGSFFTGLRNNLRYDSYRGGLRHAFSPGATLLASVTYKLENSGFRNDLAPDTWQAENRPNGKALGTELQYLYRSAVYNITAGAGYFDLNQSLTRTSDSPLIPLPSPPFPPDSFAGGPTYQYTNTSARHTNAYVYSNIKAVPRLTLTLGASWDSLDSKDPGTQSKNQLNPKLGATWQVLPGTTLRAAAFRVLKRSLISDQTLEPTQVAGFNQFYDDVASSDAWRYGLALDQKFSQRLFGGVEAARRNLKVPYTYTAGTTSIVRANQREDNARAYLFMTPSDQVALSMEYQYQTLDHPFTTSPGFGFISKVKSHKFPLGIRYFTASGWTFGVTGTFVHETYESGPVLSGVPSVTKENSDFAVADATVSYRLPRRRGLVAVGATNLFDKHFVYEQVDGLNPAMQPARMIFGRVTLYFP